MLVVKSALSVSINMLAIPIDMRTVPIKWRLAAIMADREMSYKDVAALADLHPVTVNKLKNTYEMPARLDRGTLDKLCRVLDCQPGDLLRHIPDPEGDCND